MPENVKKNIARKIRNEHPSGQVRRQPVQEGQHGDGGEITPESLAGYGFDFTLYDRSFFAKRVAERMLVTLSTTFDDYRLYVACHHEEAQLLFAALHICHSEYFRDPLSFALLEQVILPRLAEQKHNAGATGIRCWSAACAGGQEAYSLAITADAFRSSHGKTLSFNIFATDIAAAELLSARRGVYDAAALQNVPLRHLRSYFTSHGETYALIPALKDSVTFAQYNLLDEHSTCPSESIYGDFDLVFCSNLLFYYRPEIRQFILNKMHRRLSREGYLLTGEAEAGIVEKAGGFRPIVQFLPVFQKIEPRW